MLYCGPEVPIAFGWLQFPPSWTVTRLVEHPVCAVWTPGHLLLMLAVVPVVSLMLAGQEVGPVVPLTLHELEKMMGAVVPLLHW